MDYCFLNDENTVVDKIDDDGVSRVSFLADAEGSHQDEYRAWLRAGNVTKPYIPPLPPIPQQVPMWAVRTVLQNYGLFDRVQTLISASNDNALKNIWEYGHSVYRDSAIVTSLAGSLGLTREKVDQMFVDANDLTI